jgi:hypothetical protein
VLASPEYLISPFATFAFNLTCTMDKIFHFEQIKFSKALAGLTGAGQVYKATIDSKVYAVKLVRAPRRLISISNKRTSTSLLARNQGISVEFGCAHIISPTLTSKLDFILGDVRHVFTSASTAAYMV